MVVRHWLGRLFDSNFESHLYYAGVAGASPTDSRLLFVCARLRCRIFVDNTVHGWKEHGSNRQRRDDRISGRIFSCPNEPRGGGATHFPSARGCCAVTFGRKILMFGSRTAYFVCMVAATVVASLLLKRRQKRLAIDTFQKVGIAIGGVIGATFAAKLPFVVSADPNAGVLAAWMSDGKTILWGLVGGYIGVEVAKWSLHVKASTGDTFVIPVAVTVAIGRMGCFLYGCCFGVATNQTWGVRFPFAPDAGTLLRHPTQLYELFFHFSFAAIASVCLSQSRETILLQRMRGNWMPLYLIAYSMYRFLSEYWRPEERGSAGLTFYQWSSIAIAISFVALLIARANFAVRR